MYRDHSLLPKEGVRLVALGLLAQEGPAPYVRLANAVRQFTGYFRGPTLDVMSSSIELMRFEGLLSVAEGDADTVAITPEGRGALTRLLIAPLKPGATEFNLLLVACKLRFLDLLEPAERREQIETLVEVREAERARLIELRGRESAGTAAFVSWLDHEIARLDADVRWYEGLARTFDGI